MDISVIGNHTPHTTSPESQRHEGFQRVVHHTSTSSNSTPMLLRANFSINAFQPISRHFTLMPCTSPAWSDADHAPLSSEHGLTLATIVFARLIS
ncbi:hypothetical protein XF_2717 [Xylella fastidiosa 9a5c]|uniref:Uncharacterized protein n=1 Tax=Xylella fastidiosa (strain 9a5c) TaxID=160492 RepID=Q9PA03_XYLFA|nr:hypothetical protein XF_2717 [Xylella fastidiosa 9a5c]